MHGVDVKFISFIMFPSHNYDESMRGQQNILLLWLFLGEQGKIFSHTLHDVAEVGDGTIMVQRGYSINNPKLLSDSVVGLCK